MTIKKVLLIFILFFYIGTIGKNLIPSQTMFDFHDMTLAGRVQEFSFNISNLKIPRMAPHWVFGMGYPVFNFYAPFSFWITSIIDLLGVDIADSIKLSFLLALLLGTVSMFLFLRSFFSFYAAVLGGVLYSSSPFLAVDIFIRGNIGEIWFWALFPLTLFLLYKNSSKFNKYIFVSAIISIAALLTSHNILSLISVPILILYIVLLSNKKNNAIVLSLGFGLSAYFLLPSLLELDFIQARNIAANIRYQDQFVCLSQLWHGRWEYNGTGPGCDDGISFMLGKIHILFAVMGLCIFLYNLFIKKHSLNETKIYLFVFCIGLFSTYLTTYFSQIVWDFFAPFMRLFQFPWRLLILSIFGVAFAGAYVFDQKLFNKYWFIIPLIIMFVCYYNMKFFQKAVMTKNSFTTEYLSDFFTTKRIFYKIPEYLPNNASYKEYLKYEPVPGGTEKKQPSLERNLVIDIIGAGKIIKQQNNPYTKTAATNARHYAVNILYFPYWSIHINDKLIVPTKFDSLGRPVVKTDGKLHNVNIVYEESVIEKAGNLLSLISILLLIGILVFSQKRLTTKA